MKYDEQNDDWACLEPPTKPHRYLVIPQKYQSLAADQILEFCSNTLAEMEKDGDLNIELLKNAMAITTGFDDGALVKIR